MLRLGIFTLNWVIVLSSAKSSMLTDTRRLLRLIGRFPANVFVPLGIKETTITF